MSVWYFFIGDIVHEDAAISPPIKGSSKASEFLLSGSVPDLGREKGYLEVDDFAVNDDLLFHKVGSDGGLVGVDELLINVAKNEGMGTNSEGMFSRLYIIRGNSYAESPRIITFESFFLLIITNLFNYYLLFVKYAVNNISVYKSFSFLLLHYLFHFSD